LGEILAERDLLRDGILSPNFMSTPFVPAPDRVMCRCFVWSSCRVPFLTVHSNVMAQALSSAISPRPNPLLSLLGLAVRSGLAPVDEETAIGFLVGGHLMENCLSVGAMSGINVIMESFKKN
jgi:hypothetical protein